ncbi:hypothetical protein AVEN_185070-1 [Araneus ventricosus]|uniref:Uncharacterized protein n=1 Tax=Araneus ventricosus TaxID=182803 RepID=A0A4Y2BPX3_ARAVE|nr:hypothetical protein AVEN_185070-1 [Araneus ventricosus]
MFKNSGPTTTPITDPNKGRQPSALGVPRLGAYLGASRNLYAQVSRLLYGLDRCCELLEDFLQPPVLHLLNDHNLEDKWFLKDYATLDIPRVSLGTLDDIKERKI